MPSHLKRSFIYPMMDFSHAFTPQKVLHIPDDGLFTCHHTSKGPFIPEKPVFPVSIPKKFRAYKEFQDKY
jgi:hypothetical protein